jgi:hypothetical protein
VKRSFLLIVTLALIALGMWWIRVPSSSGTGAGLDIPLVASPGSTPLTVISKTGNSVLGGAPMAPAGEPPVDPGTEDLQTVIRAVQATLPKITELKPADDEAAHHVGPELIRAGQALGDLAEYLERRPEEFKSASVFYASCAADENLMPASRAVCYAALARNKGQWAPGVAERISRVGPDIVDIAKNLSN